MLKFKIKLFAISLISLLSVISHATPALAQGASARGGGDLYACSPGILPSGQQNRLLGDLVGMVHQLPTSFFDQYSLEVVRTSTLHYLDQYQPKYAHWIRQALDQLKFQNAKHPLTLVNTGIVDPEQEYLTQNLLDESLLGGISDGLFAGIFNSPEISKINTNYTLPNGCKKIQIAVQNFSTSTVDIDPHFYPLLTNLEKVFLEIHEAYLWIGKNKGLNLLKTEAFARTQTLSIWIDLAHLISEFPNTNAPLGHELAKDLVNNCSGKFSESAGLMQSDAQSNTNTVLPTMDLCLGLALEEISYTHCSKPITDQTQDLTDAISMVETCRHSNSN